MEVFFGEVGGLDLHYRGFSVNFANFLRTAIVFFIGIIDLFHTDIKNHILQLQYL